MNLARKLFSQSIIFYNYLIILFYKFGIVLTSLCKSDCWFSALTDSEYDKHDDKCGE